MSDTNPRKWDRWIPWFTTIASVVILVAIATFLINNVYWFRSEAISRHTAEDLYAFQMLLAMVKRSVGLFAGFALVFLGTSIAFYTVRQETSLEAKARDLSARLVTASPGIVAMVLGTGLIAFTIYSKDSFPPAPGDAQPHAIAPDLLKAPAKKPQLD